LSTFEKRHHTLERNTFFLITVFYSNLVAIPLGQSLLPRSQILDTISPQRFGSVVKRFSHFADEPTTNAIRPATEAQHSTLVAEPSPSLN
jgi:hypothetical protein